MANETAEQLAKIIGEMRDTVSEKLESMYVESVARIPTNGAALTLVPKANIQLHDLSIT
jgi:hypothetical protein